MTLSILSDILLSNLPFARAEIRGNSENRSIRGEVNFYQIGENVIVAADINGLPQRGGNCECGVFGFHIHDGESCTGTREDPFADTKGHYNPKNCPHPCHAGDMPPLLENSGRAWMAFMTDRFSVTEIIGKTVVVHSKPDDFTTQPAGNSGQKIACGVIERLT